MTDSWLITGARIAGHDGEAADIVIRDGAPTQASPARTGHFLDRAS